MIRMASVYWFICASKTDLDRNSRLPRFSQRIAHIVVPVSSAMKPSDVKDHYFTKDVKSKKHKCSICGKWLSGSNTSLASHIRTQHKLTVPEPDPAEENAAKRQKVSTLDTFVKAKNNLIDMVKEKMAVCFAALGLSFRVASTPEWRDMCAAIVKASKKEGKIVLPSRAEVEMSEETVEASVFIRMNRHHFADHNY